MQQKLTVPQFWWPEVQNQGVGRATVPLGLQEEPSLDSPSFLWLPAGLGLRLHHSHLCLHPYITFSVSLLKTLVLEFRIHLDNPG